MKHKLVTRSVIVLLLALSNFAFAQETADKKWQVELSATLANKFLSPAGGIVLYPHNNVVTDIVLIHEGEKVNLGIKFSDIQSHRCTLCTEGEEIDPQGFVEFKFPRDRKLRLSYTHLFLGGEQPSDFMNPAVVYSREHDYGAKFTFAAKADVYLHTNRRGEHSGAIFSLGAVGEKEIKNFTGRLKIEVGYDPLGTFNFKPRTIIWREEFALLYRWKKTGILLGPQVVFTGTNDPVHPGVMAVGFSISKSVKF